MHTTSVFAALLAVANAHVLRRADTCYALGSTQCTDLSIGQKDTGKQICTSISGGNLVVNYPAVSGYPYSEHFVRTYHVLVFQHYVQLKHQIGSNDIIFLIFQLKIEHFVRTNYFVLVHFNKIEHFVRTDNHVLIFKHIVRIKLFVRTVNLILIHFNRIKHFVITVNLILIFKDIIKIEHFIRTNNLILIFKHITKIKQFVRTYDVLIFKHIVKIEHVVCTND
ncbi:hypothetical protein B0A54_18108 [Friedmanniomyces endolithicus]|uniref:Secreted protein n=1 Tax=Friedmanniomyces endolithicus TaxID=329885 RepID=A0A4U0TLP1_9PEZI|nr:hypothetical protein B0A54_18108 [Friedmanniomyces endolithicus]